MTAITVSCIISNILRTGCARYAECSLLLSAKDAIRDIAVNAAVVSGME
jgi:hypothetical protein